MGAMKGVNGDSPSEPPLWITGLGAQYPPYLFGPEKLEEMVRKFHDPENPASVLCMQLKKTTRSPGRP